MAAILLLLPPLATKPQKCTWTSEAHQAVFDLAPLQHPMQFSSGGFSSLAGPLAEMLGQMADRQRTVSVALCDTGGTAEQPVCRGERAPGIIFEREAPRTPTGSQFDIEQLFGDLLGAHVERPSAQPARPAGCAVLGRWPSNGPKFSLLDPNDPSAGLQALYDKGDLCRESQRFSLLVMLRCDLRKIDAAERTAAQVQARSACEWVVSMSTAAACPVNVGTSCATNCPRTWLGDGECDPGCDTSACEHDGGDCAGTGARPAVIGPTFCAPGCQSGWIADRECDVECDTEACRFDGGDCSSTCAPGCAAAWLKDGQCDDECNTGTCRWDGGDCLRNGRPVARERCSWGCPSSWLADGQCDIGCNVTACGYDKGDCIAAWKHSGRRPQSGAPGPQLPGAPGVAAGGASGGGPLFAPTAAIVEVHTAWPSLPYCCPSRRCMQVLTTAL